MLIYKLDCALRQQRRTMAVKINYISMMNWDRARLQGPAIAKSTLKRRDAETHRTDYLDRDMASIFVLCELAVSPGDPVSRVGCATLEDSARHSA